MARAFPKDEEVSFLLPRGLADYYIAKYRIGERKAFYLVVRASRGTRLDLI